MRLLHPLAHPVWRGRDLGSIGAILLLAAAALAQEPSVAPERLPPWMDPIVDQLQAPAPDVESSLPQMADDEQSEELDRLIPPEGSLVVPNRLSSPPISGCKPIAAQEDLVSAARKRADGRYVVQRAGVDQLLTLDGELQEKLREIIKGYQTPYAAVVAIEPATGKVLAMAEHSQRDPAMHGLPTKAVFPAASIFKVITASALLDAGIRPEDSQCFHGGKRRISEKLLLDSPRDRVCYPLSTALAMSANVVFAKLTYKHLTAEKLRSLASAFHFNRAIDFPIPTEISLAAIPEDPLGLASAGSGFGDVYLSPLHAAAIAAAVATGGLWHDPVLVESGEQARDPERMIAEDNARQLTEMLEQTVSAGTARRVFRERGFRVAGAVGKTGSLADRNPFRDYSWFIGFAPKWDPRIAVAAVVVNEAKWRIRATWLAREAMRLYLDSKNALANRR
ncbi:MAG TPA: penicillin-binding transpeptidase domain-containing protein [Myxococcaceae bacterium]|nr:penicillin-binding transpeptidase domain-containing protein [Myxococcaceae bacterium]